jgi:hypothetical protein
VLGVWNSSSYGWPVKPITQPHIPRVILPISLHPLPNALLPYFSQIQSSPKTKVNMASTQSKLHASIPTDDPFDSLLTLEDTLYTSAYTAGSNAGSRAGRIEGRVFGLEQGFEKFATLGELHGRSVVWGSRALANNASTSTSATKTGEGKGVESKMPTFQPSSTRLLNNITLLHSLTDPETFSTQNTEEAVADFDDRVRRAGAKAKVVERIVGENKAAESAKSPDESPARGKARGIESSKVKKGDDSMEDFAGSRLLR